MIETIGKPNSERAEHDFYATDPNAVKQLINKENICGMTILENSAGEGHITKELNKYSNEVFGLDLIQRNFRLDWVGDFLEFKLDKRFDCAVYNPPFKLIKEFILHTWNFTNIQYVFARIQLLETKGRYEELFKQGWLEKVIVFSGRMTTAKNGDDLLFGKNNSMCFCWFKFNKNFKGKPTIEWF